MPAQVSTYKFFCWIFLTLNISNLTAQEPFYTNFGTKDGLPSSLTYSVQQDYQGFIWISTDLGVSRFDGKHFENFTTQHGLADNEVFRIFEDTQHRLWMHSFNGQLSYFLNGTFYNPENTASLKEASLDNYISHIFEDGEGNIYTSCFSNQVSIIDAEFNVQKFEESSENSNINFMWLNNAGELYITDNNRILAHRNNKVIKYSHEESPKLMGVPRGFEDDQLVYIAIINDVYIFDKKSDQIIQKLRIPEINTEIIHVQVLEGNLWLGTRDGILKVEPLEKNFKSYRFEKYLTGHQVSSVLKDQENNLWFTTLDEGVFFTASPKSQHFTQANKLNSNKVFFLNKDHEGKIWIGSEKNKYSVLTSDTIHHYDVPDQRDLEVANIKHFSDGSHWVLGQGIMMKHHPTNPTYLFSHSDDLLLDRDGYYWIGHKKMMRFSKEEMESLLISVKDPHYQRKRAALYHITKQRKGIDHNRFTYLVEGQNRRVWAGTTTGLTWYEYRGPQVKKSADSTFLKGKITDLIYEEKKDWLWVATATNGVHLIRGDSIFKSYTLSDGLSSNIINAIYLDGQDQLWVGTVNGLDKIVLNTTSGSVQNFTAQHGIYNIKINDITIKDDRIYLASDNGILTLPVHYDFKTIPPNIYINQLKVNGQAVAHQQEIKLDYFENSIEIFFNGLSYRDLGNLKYFYRLKNTEEKWTYTNSNSILYRSLPPGDHQFEIKAVNNRGKESIQPAILKFSIAAPFWKKSWFLISSGMLLTMVLYLIVKRRIHRLQQRHQISQRLVQTENEKLELEKNFLELEMRALRMQMNPHFLFNALNTIKGYYAEDKVKEANAYISKFAQLLRLILKHNDKYISLEKEINILMFYLQLTQIRYDYKFDFRIESGNILDRQDIAIPPMLLQPMIENAIIHGLAPCKHQGMIDISFEIKDRVLVSKVKDNGIGRKAAEQYQKHRINESKATQITQQRLEIINKNYNISNYFAIKDLEREGKAVGTEVVIITPLKKLWT